VDHGAPTWSRGEAAEALFARMPTFPRPAQELIADLSEQFLRPEEYERVAQDAGERTALRERLAAVGLREQEVELIWAHFGLDRVVVRPAAREERDDPPAFEY
jgi:hypothetical protein